MNIHNWTEAVITYFGCFKEKPNVRSFEVFSSLFVLLSLLRHRQTGRCISKAENKLKERKKKMSLNAAYRRLHTLAKLQLLNFIWKSWDHNCTSLSQGIYELIISMSQIFLAIYSWIMCPSTQLEIIGYLCVGVIHSCSPAYFCWVATECLSVKAIWWIKLVIADGCLSLT